MTGTHLVPFERLPLDKLHDVAKAFAASGYFKDANDAAKAFTKVLAGQELGVPPMQAMTGIHIVQGKPTLSSTLVGAMIKRSGRYDYRVRVQSDEECVLAFYEHGEEVGESAFTMNDARKAGLTSNPTWKNYPRNMLMARALTNGARWYCPDVFGGAIYTPDELGAVVDHEGDIIDQPDEPTAAIEAADAEPLVSHDAVDVFSQLLTRIAEADDDPDHTVNFWKRAANQVAMTEYGKPILELTVTEFEAVVRQFQTHYGELIAQGSGGEPGDTPVDTIDGSGVADTPHGQPSPAEGVPSPPDTDGEPSQPGTDGGPASVEANGVAEAGAPLFKAPTAPRGSKRGKQVAS